MLPAMQTPISTPPPVSPEEGRILARQRVRARKQRARTIRRRVIATTLSLFLAAWVVMFGRLVTGHDPALGATKHTARASGAGTTSQTSTAAQQPASPSTDDGGSSTDSASSGASDPSGSASSSDPGSDGSSSSGSSASGSSSGSSGASAVTTSQS